MKGGPKLSRYEPRTCGQALGYLVEECGEVLAAAGKTLRWGPLSTNPTLPESEQETNRDWVLRELAECEAHEREFKELKIRHGEMRNLLHRMVRAIKKEPPVSNRLEKLASQIEDYLKRTADPRDILRTSATPARRKPRG